MTEKANTFNIIMARPVKDGLDYFPFDTDFFEDDKIEAISGEFGAVGELLAIRLLCAVYRNGYYTEWTELLKMRLAKDMGGIPPDRVGQIVERLAGWGFFDKSLYDSAGVLTSAGIQNRYFGAVKRRKPRRGELPFLLADGGAGAASGGINAYNNPVNACRNSGSDDINAYNNPVNACINSPSGNINVCRNPVNACNNPASDGVNVYINSGSKNDECGINVCDNPVNVDIMRTETPLSGINVCRNPVNAYIYPQSKIYNSNNNRIDVESGAGAYTYERFLEEFFHPNNTPTIEGFCMSCHVRPDEFRRIAAEVVNEWRLTRAVHDGYSDAARHLISQARIKINSKKSNDESKTRYDPRRGVDPTAEEHQDWDSAF